MCVRHVCVDIFTDCLRRQIGGVQSQGCIGPQGQRSQRDCDDENDGKKTLKSTDNDLWFMEGSIDLTGKNLVHSWQVRGVGLVATGVTNHLSGVAPGSLSKIAHDFTGDSDARTSCQGGGPESGDNAHPKESPQIWHCHHHTTNPVAPRSVGRLQIIASARHIKCRAVARNMIHWLATPRKSALGRATSSAAWFGPEANS